MPARALTHRSEAADPLPANVDVVTGDLIVPDPMALLHADIEQLVAASGAGIDDRPAGDVLLERLLLLSECDSRRGRRPVALWRCRDRAGR